jgi:hypothetical protein
MQKSIAKIGFLSTVGVISISLTGCAGLGKTLGLDKTVQCNKIIKVTQSAAAAVKELESASKTKDAVKIIQSFADTSVNIGKMSKEMQALEINDEKLKGLQTNFVKLYQDNSTGLGETGTALKENNQPVAQAAIAKMVEGDKQEVILVNDLNSYCSRK